MYIYIYRFVESNPDNPDNPVHNTPYGYIIHVISTHMITLITLLGNKHTSQPRNRLIRQGLSWLTSDIIPNSVLWLYYTGVSWSLRDSNFSDPTATTATQGNNPNNQNSPSSPVIYGMDSFLSNNNHNNNKSNPGNPNNPITEDELYKSYINKALKLNCTVYIIMDAPALGEYLFRAISGLLGSSGLSRLIWVIRASRAISY